MSPDPAAVHDEKSFLAFVAALAAESGRAEKTPEDDFDAPLGWQNRTVESFLEAAVEWARTTHFGRTQGLGDETPVWQRFAIFLQCGKIYE